MVLIEYEEKDTIMHRLDPRSKLLFLLVIGWFIILYLEPRPLIILWILVCVLGGLSQLPWRKLLKNASWIFVLLTIVYFILSLWVTTPEFFKTIPKEFATKTILVIAPEGTPLVGYLAVTYGGLLYFIAGAAKSMLAVVAFCIFAYTTSQIDIIQLLAKIRVPSTVIFVIMAAIRYYPLMLERLRIVMLAQRSKGWEIKARNPAKLVKSLLPLTIPMFSEAISIADRFALAAQCRGYGVGKIGFLRKFHFTISDYIFCALLIALLILLTLMWLLYGFGAL